jgi:ribosomal protein S18 acetylase RimI-like enzyme
MESAEYHARIDPERYAPPALETISARYCEELRDLSGSAVPRTIFVAELAGEIVGFVEAQLEQSPDLMHREMTYCHISEIAVSSRNQEQGIGTQLLRAAEDWGRDQGAQFASLEYHVANPSAARFYQRRMGYLPAATIAIKSI